MIVHSVLTNIVALAHLPVAPADPPVSIPNPAPQAPGGPNSPLSKTISLMLAVLKWGGLVSGVVMFVAAGIMMILGRRNRNNMAVDGALSVPWVVGGLALVMGATSFVAFVIQ